MEEDLTTSHPGGPHLTAGAVSLFQADTQPDSLHSSFEDTFNFVNMVPPESVGLPPPTPGDLAALGPLTPSALNGAMASIAGGMPFSQAPPPIGSPIIGSMPMTDVTSVSRNSISPAMSDSGISVDNSSTNSNNSATMFNVAAMANMTKFPNNPDAAAALAGKNSSSGREGGLLHVFLTGVAS